MPDTQPALIITKLSPPVARTGLIARPRLLVAAQAGADCKLTLVTAPAGFGKSTLLVQWRQTLIRQGANIGWLSLDANDRDPVRFLHYLAGALHSAGGAAAQSALALLEGHTRPAHGEVIARMVNDMAQSAADLMLFLDDYHLVDSPAINEIVETLLARTPAHVHFVIASRRTPGLPLARLRVRDELAELDAATLRFNRPEAGDFISQARGLAITPAQVSTLHQRTEGWIAGLQLAALSLRDHNDPAAFIDNFSGGARAIADYLANDVLNQQPAILRDFLLASSVLERMDARACAAVTQNSDSQQMLEDLERENLFIIPLDEDRRWYRYHALFRDFLARQRRRRRPGEDGALLHRAGEDFAARGLVDEAINYILAAGDGERAAEMIEDFAVDIMSRGLMPRMLRWIDKIPQQVAARRPRLHLARCWAYFHIGDAPRAGTALRHGLEIIERLRQQDGGLAPDQLALMEEEIKVLRTGVAISADDYNLAKALAKTPLKAMSGRHMFLTGAMQNMLGYACVARSEFMEARAALARARACHLGAANGSLGVVYSDCFLAMAEMAEGRLRAAAALAEQADDIARQDHEHRSFSAAIAQVVRGAICYEGDRLDEARRFIEPNLPLIDEFAHIEGRTMGYLTMARIHAARGEAAACDALLERARTMARHGPFDRLLAVTELEAVRQFLARVQPALALDSGRVLGIFLDQPAAARPESWDRVAGLRELARARLLIACEQPDEALAILAHLKTLAERVGRRTRVLEILVLMAGACQASGQQDLALEALGQALEIAAPENFRRVFLDEGAGLRALLGQALARAGLLAGPARQHGHAVFAAGDTPPCAAPAPDFTLSAPLSPRERDVLRLVAGGRANRDIAAALTITENTVKWHVKNIFAKLGVANRTSAVLAARALHLIA